MEVGGEFLELGVGAADVAELGGSELGEVGLLCDGGDQQGVVVGRMTYAEGGVDVAYVDVEAEDGVFLSCALETGDFGLELVLLRMLLRLLLLLLLLLLVTRQRSV